MGNEAQQSTPNPASCVHPIYTLSQSSAYEVSSEDSCLVGMWWIGVEQFKNSDVRNLLMSKARDLSGPRDGKDTAN